MKKWLKVLLTADFFCALAVGMLVPIYAIFVEKIGGDVLDASNSWAIFSIIAGILIYLIGRWEDKNKHYARMLFVGYLLRSIGFLGYFFVENTWHLLIVQVVLGISVAVTSPAYDALYSKFLDTGKFATEWGLWEGMNMVVSGIAAFIGGTIVVIFGFHALFMAMFLTGIIGAIFSGRLLSKKATEEISQL